MLSIHLLRFRVIECDIYALTHIVTLVYVQLFWSAALCC